MCGKLIKAVTIFEMLAHLRNLPGSNADTAILPVLPALMFEIRSEPHCALAVGSRSLAVFFSESAALDGGDVGELVEGGLAHGYGVGGVHG